MQNSMMGRFPLDWAAMQQCALGPGAAGAPLPGQGRTNFSRRLATTCRTAPPETGAKMWGLSACPRLHWPLTKNLHIFVLSKPPPMPDMWRSNRPKWDSKTST